MKDVKKDKIEIDEDFIEDDDRRVIVFVALALLIIIATVIGLLVSHQKSETNNDVKEPHRDYITPELEIDDENKTVNSVVAPVSAIINNENSVQENNIKESYEITYHYYGKTHVIKVNDTAEKYVPLGYSSCKYYMDENNSIEYDFNEKVASSKDIYMSCEEKVYTIKYSHLSNNKTEYKLSDGIVPLEDAETDLIFNGWYTDKEYTNKVTNLSEDLLKYSSDGIINLYASFIPYYTINYYNNNDGFYNDIKRYDGILYTLNDKIIVNCINNDIKYVKGYLNSGFEYLGNYYFSDNDLLFANKKSRLESDFKYGTKIDSLSRIEVGDYVVHRKSGIGIYMGIKTLTKNGIKKDYILIQYKGNDRLYLPVQDIDKLYKYTSKEGAKPTIYKLNSVEWNKTKLKIKERIKNITSELLKIYKERNIVSTIPYSKDDESQIIFESSFEYEETSDQRKVTDEIKRDLESGRPMDRLLCGDVGYGKTEVIFRAIFKTVLNGKQAMYLCPTTILSLQQYNSALARFRDYGVNVDLINRNFSDSQIKNKIELLKEGKTDVIFGTHRLLSNDIEFKDLGLLVIDEEHRFGVEQKEKIKSLKSNVHVLSVSATPIPRSLQMSLTGIRDMSLIETAPRNRYPVQTYVIEYNDMLLRDAVIKELSRNGQVFILFNNIINMEELVLKYRKLIPEARICYAHGKMNKDVMNDVISDFKNYKYDVLVSTTIIENGIDIPNANTIIVIDADKFGLSQLYQIRGRVGRSDRIAYAYLMYKKDKMLNSTSIKRLDAMKEFTELGSGYRISMRDLAIRGAGDILGSEQAGFIDSVGVDMYLELINESINNIDEDNEVISSVHSLEVQTHIDEKYSDESDIVIDLHRKINSIVNKVDLNKILVEVKDRFGIVDESIKLYAYEKYYENLVKINNIYVVEDNNIRITFSIKPSVYNNLDVQELFVRTSRLSTKFNFNYKNNVIFVSLLKGNLDKNYIYYVTHFMEIIFDLKK